MNDFKDKLNKYKNRNEKQIRKDKVREKDLMEVLVEVTAKDQLLKPRRKFQGLSKKSEEPSSNIKIKENNLKEDMLLMDK